MTQNEDFTELFNESLIYKPDRLFGVVPKDEQEWRRRLAERYISPAVVDLLERQSDLSGELASRYLEDLGRYFHEDEMDLLVWSPLSKFSSEVERCEIDDLTVAKMAMQERVVVYAASEKGSISGWYGVRSSFKVEAVQKTPKFGGVDTSVSREKFRRLVSAMRLLRRGGVNSYYAFHREAVPSIFYRHSGSGGNNPVNASGPDFVLKSDDIPQLQKLYSALDRPQVAEINLALERFNIGLERERPPDRIIDYWVGLEALFAPDDKQEFKYRLRLRTAYYLSDDADDRETIYQTLGTSYDARSRIVHGKPVPADADAIAMATEEVLRRTIRKIVTAGRFNADRLDVAIARGGRHEQEPSNDPTE